MSILRWVVVAVGGVSLAVATGAGASYAREGSWGLATVTVFALLTFPCWVGLLRVLLAGPDEAPPEHHEDSVEARWVERATSAAFLDVVIALGLATAATSVAGIAPVSGVVFLTLAMVDVSVRYAVLQRRES